MQRILCLRAVGRIIQTNSKHIVSKKIVQSLLSLVATIDTTFYDFLLIQIEINLPEVLALLTDLTQS